MHMNNIELRIYGLMRSGNHAIINWIQAQYTDQSICFLNNVAHGDHDPFNSYRQIEIKGMNESSGAKSLRGSRKQVLIYSYEDRANLEEPDRNEDFISSVFCQSFESNREKYLGSSRKRFDVCIIRDPFNCFASRLKLIRTKGPMGGASDMPSIVQNWKSLARHAIELSSNPNNSQIVINYNRWVKSQIYRKELSSKLCGSFSDSSIDEISQYGGGSSFDLPKLKLIDALANFHKVFSMRRLKNFRAYLKRMSPQSPRKDNLFLRWKLFYHDPTFRKIFDDPELLNLSESLFGEIPGTRDFVSAILSDKFRQS